MEMTEEIRSAIHKAAEYCNANGLGAPGDNVFSLVVDDAEHLRAEIERQREEIAALRKFETIDGVLKNYRYQEMHALQMTEAKIARWTSEEITLHRSEREQVLLEAINILQSENNTLKRRLGRSLVINVGRRTQAKNLKQTIARLTENLSEWKRAFLDKDKAHRKLSAVLRMHWTPEEWHEKRRLTALAHPELFDGDKE